MSTSKGFTRKSGQLDAVRASFAFLRRIRRCHTSSLDWRSAASVDSARELRPESVAGARVDSVFWSEILLSFSRRHLEKLVGLRGSLPGSLAGSLADVLEKMSRMFNCFFLARGVEEGVAAEDLLSLGERAVGDRDFAVGSFVHADACGAKVHALAFEQPSRLHALDDELVHGRHLGLCRQATR